MSYFAGKPPFLLLSRIPVNRTYSKVKERVQSPQRVVQAVTLVKTECSGAGARWGRQADPMIHYQLDENQDGQQPPLAAG